VLLSAEKAVEIFTRVVVERVIVFRSKEVIVAACIYIAARVEHYPRTLDEIGAATNIATKEITKIQKVIISKLNIILCRLHPEHLLNRFCSRMQCTYQVNVMSKDICSNLLKYELLESIPPQVVISGVILLSMALLDASIDVSRLLSIALINLSSLKLIVKQLMKLLKVILPEQYQSMKSELIENKLTSALNGNSGGVDQKKKDQSGAAVVVVAAAVVNRTISTDSKKYTTTTNTTTTTNNINRKCEKIKLLSTSTTTPHSAAATVSTSNHSNIFRNVAKKESHAVVLKSDIDINKAMGAGSGSGRSQESVSSGSKSLERKVVDDDDVTSPLTTVGVKRRNFED